MAEMDRDMTVWLASQLAQPWTAERVSTALTSDVLRQVESKWSRIEPPVKLRVMCSLVSMKRDPAQAARWDAFESLLNVAAQDQDEWVSVIANIVKTITQNGSTAGIQHSHFKSITADIAEKLSKVGSTALRDLQPQESLYLSAEGDGDQGTTRQRGHAHFMERTPFKAENIGLRSLCVEAVADDEEQPRSRPDRTAPSRIFSSKAATPRGRDPSLWGSSGPNLADYARQERKVVVEEADEEDLGDGMDAHMSSKRKRSALMPAKKEKHGEGEGRHKKLRGAAHTHASAHHDGEEDSDEEANSGPAPFGDAGVDSGYVAPAYSYADPADAGYSYSTSSAQDEEEPEIIPPPQPERIEGMEEWKKKLTSVAGLVELVQTSDLGQAEIVAIIDFIQGKKQNPFADGQIDRTYVIREERTAHESGIAA